MNYSYNYAFLRQFMDKHHLRTRDIVEALGSKDFASPKNWYEGKVPVHICAMLRICNYYNIPLANFFVDEDGLPADFEPCAPDKTAQLLPTDNYGIKEGAGRGIVITKITERKATTLAQKDAVEIGLKNRDAQLERNKGILKGNTGQMKDEHVVDVTHEKSIREVIEKCLSTVNNLVAAHNAQIESLVNIIKDQEKTIAMLTNDNRDKPDVDSDDAITSTGENSVIGLAAEDNHA